MTENDYVELRSSEGPIGRFVEGNHGWWVFEGSMEGWEFSKDEIHGFVMSFTPPGGEEIVLGSAFVTARGRDLVVASIVKKEGQQVRVILMPRE